MRLGGPLGLAGAGPPPFGGRAQALLVEPALQGALGRQVRAGMAALEEDPNQSASPGGVFPAQRQGLVAEGVLGSAPGATAGVVGRPEGVGSLVSEALQEAADGARAQAEFVSDGVGGLLPLLALPDGLAERYGDGGWHADSGGVR